MQQRNKIKQKPLTWFLVKYYLLQYYITYFGNSVAATASRIANTTNEPHLEAAEVPINVLLEGWEAKKYYSSIVFEKSHSSGSWYLLELLPYFYDDLAMINFIFNLEDSKAKQWHLRLRT